MFTCSKGSTRVAGVAVVLVLASAGVAVAQPSTYRVVAKFGNAGLPFESAHPTVLMQAADGTFYGGATHLAGIESIDGVIFKMTPDGVLTVIRQLPENLVSLVQAPDGALYGTIHKFGSQIGFHVASVVKMTPNGATTLLYQEGEPEFRFSYPSRVMWATDGNLYVTHETSGNIVRVTVDGASSTVLHRLVEVTEGATPKTALVQATDGAFYGTTTSGGPFRRGTLFKMTRDGTVTVLHPFAGGATDGDTPAGALIQAADGNLYGTTLGGGPAGIGTIFKITPGGTLTILHSFVGGAADGALPAAALIQASDGAFYGTTTRGGAANLGTIFQMAADGTITLLHSFVGGEQDGARPSTPLIQATDGNLYGATSGGGTLDRGVVFRLAPVATSTANVSLSADFDGDGKTDLCVWRPIDGTWYVLFSSSHYSYAGWTAYQWGLPGDIPVVADFDGDGKADLVVWRPSNGTWYIRFSSSDYSYSTWTAYQWGLPGDLPVPGDFDGDGKTDLAVWRPSNGTWYVRFSSSNYSYSTWTAYQWGLPGDTPTVADLDGDHKADLVVWRPGDGTWYVRFSSNNYSYATWTAYQWGLPGDVPLVADIDGDGKTDLTVWRPSNGTWYVRLSSSNSSYATWAAYQWGLPGDVPIPGDFDGDHKADLVVWRPSDAFWYLRFSPGNYSYANWLAVQWGLPGDLPM